MKLPTSFYRSFVIAMIEIVIFFGLANFAFGQKTEIVIQKKHSETIMAMAVSTSNNLLVTGDFIGKVKCWDLLSQKLITTIDIASSPILQISINEGDKKIGVLTDRRLFIIGLDDLSLQKTLSSESIWEQYQNFAFIPGTKKLAMFTTFTSRLEIDTCFQASIKIYGTDGFQVADSQNLRTCNTNLSADFNPSESVYYILENGTHILKYSLNSGIKLVSDFTVSAKPAKDMIVSPASGDIFLSGGDLDSIVIIDGKTNKIKSEMAWSPNAVNHIIKYTVKDCWLTNNGHTLCTSFDRALHFWDIDKKKWVASKVTATDEYNAFTCLVFDSLTHGFVSSGNTILAVDNKNPFIQEVFKTAGALSEGSIGKIISFNSETKKLSFLNNHTRLEVDFSSLLTTEENEIDTHGLVIYRATDSVNSYNDRFYIAEDNISKNYYYWSQKNVLLDSLVIPDSLKEKMVLHTYISSNRKIVLQLTKNDWTASFENNLYYYLFYDTRQSNLPQLVRLSGGIISELSPTGNIWVSQYDLSNDPGKVNQFIAIYEFGRLDPFDIISCGDSVTFLKKTAFLQEEKLLLFLANDGTLFFYNLQQKKLSKGYNLHNPRYDDFRVDQKNNRIFFFSSSFREPILIYNYSNRQIKFVKNSSSGLNDVAIVTENMIITSSKDDYVRLFNIGENKVIETLYFINENNFIMFTPYGYYYNNNLNPENIGFRVNGKIYGLEQYDMLYNRPDLVLSETGFGNPTIIDKYRRAYLKRLEKNGLPADLSVMKALDPDVHVSLLNPVPATSPDGKLNLQTSVSSKTGIIKKLIVLVNNVPVFGRNGLLLPPGKKSYQKQIDLQLNAGRNKIQFFGIDEDGIESFRETYYCDYLKPDEKPTLYFVGIGCSTYRNGPTLLNVDNDIRSFIKEVLDDTIKMKYSHIIIDTFINEQAIGEILPGIKKTLTKTNVDDVVILYYSGHGFKIGGDGYVLSSYETNFSSAKKLNSFQFDDIEKLLDSIPSRKKLFLLNACYAGEGDKDLEDFLTMQRMFPDIRIGDGSITIASSENTTESKATFKKSKKNSVFGYYAARGIRREGFNSDGPMEADSDNNGQLLVSELFEFIKEQTQNQTSHYKPQLVNYRTNNNDYDFAIF